jgi:hypothetical protein
MGISCDTLPSAFGDVCQYNIVLVNRTYVETDRFLNVAGIDS